MNAALYGGVCLSPEVTATNIAYYQNWPTAKHSGRILEHIYHITNAHRLPTPLCYRPGYTGHGAVLDGYPVTRYRPQNGGLVQATSPTAAHPFTHPTVRLSCSENTSDTNLFTRHVLPTPLSWENQHAYIPLSKTKANPATSYISSRARLTPSKHNLTS